MLRGIVHDPTARRMGGVAGHAGLFSTAADLSRYCRMVLGGGALGGVRILSPLTVLKMTSPATPAGMASVRGLGWDIDTSYSSNRGELLPGRVVRPHGVHGHVGVDGPADEDLRHPADQPRAPGRQGRRHAAARPRRDHRRLGAAATCPTRPRCAPRDGTAPTSAPPAPRPRRADEADGRTLNGIDVLRADSFRILKGKRVGLVTNHTGRARTGEATIDLLAGLEGRHAGRALQPRARHPRHRRREGRLVEGREDRPADPLALRQATMRPTDEMLQGIDTMVIDLQDIGARFYTYTTTMAYVMEEAAKRKIAVVVLDRPNPIGGAQIEGPTLDKSRAGVHGLHADADPATA